MALKFFARMTLLGGAVSLLAACGGGLLGRPLTEDELREREVFNEMVRTEGRAERLQTGGSLDEMGGGANIWSLFGGGKSDQLGASVNRHLWNASLDTLSFLPIETVDPFTGVISTGYGTPPGGSRAYRATVYISDPSLDARSLKVAMQTSGGGAVSADIVRQVEDAILTRARQLRTRDSRF